MIWVLSWGLLLTWDAITSDSVPQSPRPPFAQACPRLEARMRAGKDRDVFRRHRLLQRQAFSGKFINAHGQE